MILFSIIMPVYNSEKVLARSIESVLKQTVTNFELITVDDGSTDGSLKKLEEYKKKDSRVRVLRQQNSGPGIARNKAISNSGGEYIAFLDSDDYWEPDFLETVLRNSENRTADVIFVDTIKEREDGSIIKHLKVYENKGISKKEMLCRQMTGKMPWGMSKVIKREVLNSVKTGFMEFSVGEENIFSFEVLKNARLVTFVDKPIYHYIQSENGQHKKGAYDPWGPMVARMKEYLILTGDYVEFEDTLNSLALKAMTICVYRSSFEKTIVKSQRLIDSVYKKYSKLYNFKKLNNDMLDRYSIIILRFLQMRLYFVIVVASHLRKMKMEE